MIFLNVFCQNQKSFFNRILNKALNFDDNYDK
jgi:hypothetical protein